MPYDPERHHRRSIRLATFDYTRTAVYFVTLCTLNRECLFGAVADGAMRLSTAGDVARDEWLRSAEMRRELTLDAFVVMPNHVHGIVMVTHAGDGSPPATTDRDPATRAHAMRPYDPNADVDGIHGDRTARTHPETPPHPDDAVGAHGMRPPSQATDRAPTARPADALGSVGAHGVRPPSPTDRVADPDACPDPDTSPGADAVGAHGMRPPSPATMPPDGGSPRPDEPAADRPRTPTHAQSATLVRPARSLGAFIAGYKGAVTRALTQMRIVAGASVWQRNYYEHVIRNDEDLDRIRRYIANNPAQWDLDRENPANQS